MTKDEFVDIINGFSEYEDIYRTFTPYDVFDFIKTMNFDDPLFDGINLVLITSIIELLTTWVDYIPFPDWYGKNKEKYKNKKCMRVWHDYIQVHGKRKNFREFFLGFDRDEKFSLLHLVKRKRNKNEEYRPFCYQGNKCDYSMFVCQYDAIRNECLAVIDDKVFRDGIKEFANHLYDFRSLFVHETRLPRFASVPPSYWGKRDDPHIHLKPMTIYSLKEKKGYLEYYSELSVKDFFNMIMGKLVRARGWVEDRYRECSIGGYKPRVRLWCSLCQHIGITDLAEFYLSSSDSFNDPWNHFQEEVQNQGFSEFNYTIDERIPYNEMEFREMAFRSIPDLRDTYEDPTRSLDLWQI